MSVLRRYRELLRKFYGYPTHIYNQNMLKCLRKKRNHSLIIWIIANGLVSSYWQPKEEKKKFYARNYYTAMRLELFAVEILYEIKKIYISELYIYMHTIYIFNTYTMQVIHYLSVGLVSLQFTIIFLFGI